MVSPTMFFNITVDSKSLGCISFQLFADKAPRTAENFHTLSTGEKGCGYKSSCFHKTIQGFMCQGGDFTCHNGTGSKSVYWEKFDDENFILKHTGPGILCMANAGLDSTQQFPVFHLHCQDQVAGQQARGLLPDKRRHGCCDNHEALWTQEWEEDHHY
ncbi:hypothetical protein HJG60_009748 [Phyllostomus discolor]|uniref:Peptidyl-prolyl cis-trans isomerase n=1 Tax=Phyllostomus discolor TaxID=89673 RepID=A0A834ESY8_9CHIR|nr:hypothetical protein HJG60_009748 [Phyllostomus discolor]